ncbi:MAG: group 1 truncated hemoglobin [Halopseudomonas sp.]
MPATLFERLGGTDVISRIANDIVDLHKQNPRIAPRFQRSETESLKRSVAAFFCAGSGGPNTYQGKDMLATHAGMNIDASEFIAVLDDVLKAMQQNAVGQREAEEVLYILYSMKADVVLV